MRLARCPKSKVCCQPGGTPGNFSRRVCICKEVSRCTWHLCDRRSYSRFWHESVGTDCRSADAACCCSSSCSAAACRCPSYWAAPSRSHPPRCGLRKLTGTGVALVYASYITATSRWVFLHNAAVPCGGVLRATRGGGKEIGARASEGSWQFGE